MESLRSLFAASLILWVTGAGVGGSEVRAQTVQSNAFGTFRYQATVTGTFSSTGTSSNGVAEFVPGAFDVTVDNVAPGQPGFGFTNHGSIPGTPTNNLGEIVLLDRT